MIVKNREISLEKENTTMDLWQMKPVASIEMYKYNIIYTK
jgi:hypothetical protein